MRRLASCGKVRLAVFLLLFAVLGAAPAIAADAEKSDGELRTWHSADGKYQGRARLCRHYWEIDPAATASYVRIWKKQTTLPSLAYAGIPYQGLGERAGALALMIGMEPP